jgi:hypothetical protein
VAEGVGDDESDDDGDGVGEADGDCDPVQPRPTPVSRCDLDLMCEAWVRAHVRGNVQVKTLPDDQTRLYAPAILLQHSRTLG